MTEFDFDIVIIGGGAAGIASAVGASQNGKSVLLIEKTNQLGGMATHAEVGTICGLYKNDVTNKFSYNVNDFTRQFAEKIREKSNSKPIINSSGLKFLPYSIEVFKNHCQALLEKNKVSYWVDSELVDVSCRKDKITSLQVAKNGVVVKINLKAIVDSTGVSCVSNLLKEELIEPSFKQMQTQIFTLSNCDFISEENLNFVLLMKLRKEKSIDLSVVPGSFSKTKVAFKLNFKEKLTKEQLGEEVQTTFRLLKDNIDGFAKARLDSIASQLGERIGKRPVGKYVLTKEDVLSCKKFENSVANGNWPIEQWDAEQGLILEKLQKNDFYQIPKECLMSKNYSNLFYAGRNISATDEAIASARVIGTCLQTGYAGAELAIKSLYLIHD